MQALRRQQETDRKAYEKQLHQDQQMRSMQLQQNGNGNQGQGQGQGQGVSTPFNPQTPVDSLSPAQLANASPRTQGPGGSQSMQRNQSRSTGIGVGSGGSMLPPQSPANRTTTPKPVGVGVGVGVGKMTPKMHKEELVRPFSHLLTSRIGLKLMWDLTVGYAKVCTTISQPCCYPGDGFRTANGIDTWSHPFPTFSINSHPSRPICSGPTIVSDRW